MHQYMAINHSLLSRARLSGYSLAPLVLVAIGGCFALATGFLLVGRDATAAVILPLAIATLLLALWSPYWALVLTVGQFAFLPCEGELFGYFVPNALQLLAPLVLGAALLRALRHADHERLAPRLADFLVGGFGAWGLAGMFLGGQVHWKWYGNRMLFPMMLYFAVRLLPLNRKQVRTLVFVLLAAIAVQSVLMVRESMAGSSPLYQVRPGLAQGIKAAAGPFPFNWNASTYLCLWPSLFIYAIATSRDWRKKLTWGAALLAVLAASSRTMERAGIAAGLIGIAVCLLSPKLRRTALVAIGVLAAIYVPWSMGQAGGALLARFQQTDQSRYAYRTAGINLLTSSRWNPIYGIGWGGFRDTGGESGTEEEVFIWGTRATTIREAAAGAALHNVWLAIPVEFGGVGVLFLMGILGGLGVGLFRIWRHRATGAVDDGLVVSMLASLFALGAMGYYHNIYMMAESMSMLWLFYGLLTGHPRAFLEAKPGQAASEPNGLGSTAGFRGQGV